MRRGKHVTKRFFSLWAHAQLVRYALSLCVYLLAGEHIVVSVKVFGCEDRRREKKTCVFPLQHIPMTLRARDPCESICSTYINTIQSTWLVCTCCWLLLSLSDYYTIYFTLNWTASIQLVLNTRSRVEQHIQASVYLYKRFPSHNAVHIMQTERFFASNAHSSCQIQ